MRSIIEFYKNLLSENRDWLKIVANWFILAGFAGAVTFFIKPDFLQVILSTFAERFGPNPALDFNLALEIFLQNITASVVALLGGLVLGLGPLIVVAVNGFLIGFVIISLLVFGTNIFVSLLVILGGLVPHGVLELPAFFVASALGLRLGIEWLKSDAKGQRGAVLKKNFIQSLYVIPAIALVLFIAALIEVFVSGNIVDNL